MLRWRLILGTVFVAALAGICWLDYQAARPGIYLLPLAVALSLACARELLAMWQRRADGPKPLPWVVYGGTLITVLAAGSPAWLPSAWRGGSVVGNLGWLAIGLVASLLLAMIGAIRRYEGRENATSNLAYACLAVMYVGGLMGFMVQLRLLDARVGMLALLSLIAIVKFSDIGQYTVGRLFGANKLAPHVSPGKTWEGVLGGMLFAILGGLFTIWIQRALGIELAGRYKPISEIKALALLSYPIVVAAFGVVGDLAESLFKRDAGVKDSSTWLPGFGGVLDLLDSLLGAAPVAYLFWEILF